MWYHRTHRIAFSLLLLASTPAAFAATQGVFKVLAQGYRSCPDKNGPERQVLYLYRTATAILVSPSASFPENLQTVFTIVERHEGPRRSFVAALTTDPTHPRGLPYVSGMFTFTARPKNKGSMVATFVTNQPHGKGGFCIASGTYLGRETNLRRPYPAGNSAAEIRITPVTSDLPDGGSAYLNALALDGGGRPLQAQPTFAWSSSRPLVVVEATGPNSARATLRAAAGGTCATVEALDLSSGASGTASITLRGSGAKAPCPAD